MSECRHVTIDERMEGTQKDAFLAVEAHRTSGDASDWLPSTVCSLIEALHNATGRRRRERGHVGVHVAEMLWS